MTAKKSAAKKRPQVKSLPRLVPQPHGGALLAAGQPGNRGGGRPRDEVRAKLLTLSQGKSLPFLSRLLDGHVDVELYGVCVHCHERQEVPDGEAYDRLYSRVLAAVTASVLDRLRASEQTLKYGLGTKDEVEVIDSPKVQRFLAWLYSRVEAIAGAAAAEQLRAELSTYREPE